MPGQRVLHSIVPFLAQSRPLLFLLSTIVFWRFGDALFVLGLGWAMTAFG